MQLNKGDLVCSSKYKKIGVVDLVEIEDEKIWVDYNSGYPTLEKSEDLTLLIQKFGDPKEVKDRMLEIIVAQQQQIQNLRQQLQEHANSPHGRIFGDTGAQTAKQP